MASVLDSSDIAVRLADEGVPLAAIARAIRTSSSDLREQLHEALSDGRLLELPCDDWPPGCPKDQRALQISRTVRENREALHLAAMQLFSLPPSGARVLVKLLETERTSREVLHVALSRTSDPASEIKIVDVAICSLRKRLKKFGIEIVTLWAYGFQLSAAHRRRALDLLLRHVAAPPAD
jgi:two-component system, cell cycle response regulator CtrA